MYGYAVVKGSWPEEGKRLEWVHVHWVNQVQVSRWRPGCQSSVP